MDTLNALKEKIQSLEAERLRLSNEVDALRKAVEARAAALERDVSQMREQAVMLRDILGNNETVSSTFTPPTTPVATPTPVTPPTPPVVSPTPVTPPAAPPVEIQPDIPAKVSVVAEKVEEDEELILKDLTTEERKVVNVLLGHGGRYSQKNLRVEAGLSWLQANRIVSHLSERGVVALEKSGGSIDVILKDQP
jgi:hypothetical protein